MNIAESQDFAVNTKSLRDVRDFARNILGETVENIYLSYIDILSGIFLIILIWSAVRRWLIKPSRLKFDLTQKPESAIILGFIASLMVFEILSQSFYIAA